MKRFTKLERARGAPAAANETTAKRFEAIEPAAAKPASVQLELHDRYTDAVEEARREREARATELLTRAEADAAAREQPYDPNTWIDVLARGAGIGPLARLGPEPRLWLVGAMLIVLWFAIGLTAGGLAAILASGVVIGLLLARGLWR